MPEYGYCANFFGYSAQSCIPLGTRGDKELNMGQGSEFEYSFCVYSFAKRGAPLIPGKPFRPQPVNVSLPAVFILNGHQALTVAAFLADVFFPSG